jgi:hypothetical protein
VHPLDHNFIPQTAGGVWKQMEEAAPAQLAEEIGFS